MANRKYRPPLTNAEIARMRDRYADGVSIEDLAGQFQIHRSSVSDYTIGIARNTSTLRRPDKRRKTFPLARSAKPQT